MASRSVNKVILLGNLGKDAETRFTPNNVSRTTFPLATARRWKDQQTGEWREETDWHNVVLWRSENIANYLTKGKQVYVEGRIQTRSYEDKDGQKRYVTEIIADDIILLGGAREADIPAGPEYDQPRGGMAAAPRNAARPQSRTQPAADEPDLPHGVTDDDVPF